MTMEGRGMEARGEEQLYADIGARAYQRLRQRFGFAGRDGGPHRRGARGSLGASGPQGTGTGPRRAASHPAQAGTARRAPARGHRGHPSHRQVHPGSVSTLEPPEGAYGGGRYSEPQPGRLSKEETTERALEAARGAHGQRRAVDAESRGPSGRSSLRTGRLRLRPQGGAAQPPGGTGAHGRRTDAAGEWTA